ncbi:MAG: hypothetical protein ACFFBP_06725 [Promethearchaeota archaeon]
MIEKLIFLIFTFASIFLYYFWNSGYLANRTKFLLFFSFLGSLFSYFILYDFLITINDSIHIIIEKLFSFILLSISSIFLIISITIPSDNAKKKNSTDNKLRNKLNNNKSHFNKKNFNQLIEKSNDLKKIDNDIQSKEKSLQNEKENSNISKGFQGFLDRLFKEQAK